MRLGQEKVKNCEISDQWKICVFFPPFEGQRPRQGLVLGHFLIFDYKKDLICLPVPSILNNKECILGSEHLSSFLQRKRDRWCRVFLLISEKGPSRSRRMISSLFIFSPLPPNECWEGLGRREYPKGSSTLYSMSLRTFWKFFKSVPSGLWRLEKNHRADIFYFKFMFFFAFLSFYFFKTLCVCVV